MHELRIDDLAGLWRRSLIVQPDGSRDATTWVRWLQGLSDYADLRQPAGRPDFAGVGCLRQLTPAHLDWMAMQNGFAGKLSAADGIFEWRRDIDFQPPAPTPDCGRLIRDGDAMIEVGHHAPYVEHWHPASNARAPTYAIRLRDSTNGRAGQIVRVGRLFMYARERYVRLPGAPNLTACIASAGSLTEAQDMADCEISLGTIAASGWTIGRSTLPFKERRRLDARPWAEPDRVRTSDLAPDGREIAREWEVTAAEGDFP